MTQRAVDKAKLAEWRHSNLYKTPKKSCNHTLSEDGRWLVYQTLSDLHCVDLHKSCLIKQSKLIGASALIPELHLCEQPHLCVAYETISVLSDNTFHLWTPLLDSHVTLIEDQTLPNCVNKREDQSIVTRILGFFLDGLLAILNGQHTEIGIYRVPLSTAGFFNDGFRLTDCLVKTVSLNQNTMNHHPCPLSACLKCDDHHIAVQNVGDETISILDIKDSRQRIISINSGSIAPIHTVKMMMISSKKNKTAAMKKVVMFVMQSEIDTQVWQLPDLNNNDDDDEDDNNDDDNYSKSAESSRLLAKLPRPHSDHFEFVDYWTEGVAVFISRREKCTLVDMSRLKKISSFQLRPNIVSLLSQRGRRGRCLNGESSLSSNVRINNQGSQIRMCKVMKSLRCMFIVTQAGCLIRVQSRMELETVRLLMKHWLREQLLCFPDCNEYKRYSFLNIELFSLVYPYV